MADLPAGVRPISVVATTTVPADPQRTFRLFTDDVDRWWKRGPRFRFHHSEGVMRFEPGVGGRLVQVFEGGGEEEIGTISVWEPGARLVLSFRALAFEPGATTEVEVRFEPAAGGTRVTLEHRGWDDFAEDHPARRGLDDDSLEGLMGLFWAELLLSLQRLAR